MIAPRRTSANTTITISEKKLLDEIAQEWGLKPGVILRRLILYLLQGKITVPEIMMKSNIQEIDASEEKNFVPIRAALSQSEKDELLTMSKEWDFTVSTILRRLIRALTSGVIQKEELWK